ncbi:MAG: nuclear transport factor 2 family protein [Gemmatimonadaceae bacterium]
MRRIATLLIASVAAACIQSSPPMADSATVAQWDSSAANAVRASVQKGLDAFAAMDLEAIKSVLAQDSWVQTYDIDLENKPVRMATRDEAAKYAEDIFAEVKKMNGTLKVDTKVVDCRATATLGFCAAEYDFSATMPDGRTTTQPTHTTIVLARGADGWKWVHWHSSLSSAAPSASSAK